MRIVIDIDGENVTVHTDRQASETQGPPIVDAGPVPSELLQQYGHVRGAVTAGMLEQSGGAKAHAGKRGSKGARETPLNPLRAGAAAAYQRLAAGGQAFQAGESAEGMDAGKAPQIGKLSAKAKRPKGGNSKKKKSK